MNKNFPIFTVLLLVCILLATMLWGESVQVYSNSIAGGPFTNRSDAGITNLFPEKPIKGFDEALTNTVNLLEIEKRYPKVERQITCYTNQGVGKITNCIEMDRTNLVNHLVTSGEFCRVRGHMWAGNINEIVAVPATYPATLMPEQRKCIVCGLIQTKQPGEWK